MGRVSELEAIRMLPERLTDGPAALVLRGEAGTGKTALWERGVEVTGATSHVLVARPAELARHAALSGLGELVHAVDLEALDVSSECIRTLHRSLGVVPTGAVAAPSAVALAVAEVVEALCASKAVIFAVDDLQWLDPASTRVVGYVLRRLRDRPVGLLACQRGTDGANPVFTALSGPRLVVLDLAGLSADDLGELIRRRLGATFLRPQLARIHAATAGNPFYALEIAKAVLRQETPIPSHGLLPLPQELAGLVGGRLAALPAAVREVLLVVAMSQPTTVEQLERVAGRAARGPLQRALDAGVLVLAAGQVRFAHPLLAEAAYAQADQGRRRRLHLRLADGAADVEVRGHHLSAATALPDAGVAAVVEEAAISASARGAPEIGAELFARAADLTPPTAAKDRQRRRLHGAEQQAVLGHSERAQESLRALSSEMDPGPDRARVWHRLGMLERALGTWAQAIDTLRRGLAEAGADRALAAELAAQLATFTMQAGDLRAAGPYLDEARAYVDDRTPTRVRADIDVMALMLATASGTAPHPAWVPSVMRLGGAVLDGTQLDEDDSMRAVGAGCTLKWLDEFAHARRLLAALVQILWERQQDGLLMPPLFQLCELECWSGHIERAGELGALLEQTVRRAGHRWDQMFLYTNALLHFCAGDLVAARDAATRCLDRSRETGDLRNQMRALTLRGTAALHDGDPECGARALDAAADLEETYGYRNPAVIRGAADHVEALLAVGRAQDAARRIAVLHEHAERTRNPWTTHVTARSRGLAASAEGRLTDAVRDLTFATALPVAGPVERGRTLLALATVQRRARRRAAARSTAQAALSVLEGTGVTFWSARAQGELDRLTGATTQPTQLTPMEGEIARAVAAGLMNKEIAASVHVSAKTVEAHLTHIYLKLGVRSRTELARHLNETSRVTRDFPEAPATPPF